MSSAPALSRTGVRGLGFQVRNTGKYEDNYRLYATAQWSEEGVQRSKMRSISVRGVPRAAQKIAKVLVKYHPAHQDKNPEEMVDTCQKALDSIIVRIHEQDEYPSDRGLDTEKRLQAVHSFVEESPRL